MSSLKHVYLGMGDGVACWGTLLGGSGFKSRPKYDLFLTPCTSADVPWKKVDTGGQLWPSVYLLMYVCRRILAIFWPFGPFGTLFSRFEIRSSAQLASNGHYYEKVTVQLTLLRVGIHFLLFLCRKKVKKIQVFWCLYPTP